VVDLMPAVNLRVALTVVAACLVAGSPAAAQPAAPAALCTRAVDACVRWVTLGNGPRRIMAYATYPLDRPNAAVTRALVMVHGAARNPDHYFETSTSAGFLAGALADTVIVAPRFAAGNDRLAPNEVRWPEGAQNWRSGGALPDDPALTSFDAMDAILRALADKARFPNLREIVVAGHSAGGQFVTRYEMANLVHETLGVPVTYVVANPSSYAWPAAVRPLPTGNADPASAVHEAVGDDGERVNARFTFGPFDRAKLPDYDRWPMGLENLTGYAARSTGDVLIRHLVERPTTYLLGQVDVLPLGGFDDSPPAMAQGPTRRARGEAFFAYLTGTLHAKQRAMIVPECGHNDRCIFTTASVLPILFP
jgi:pimeloyl-ACP methyl ester carboxylesterase